MGWRDTRLAALLGVELPILQAPMASVSTPELAAAASNAGALGSLGTGLASAGAVREAIRRTRELTDRPFSVNLFCWDDVGAPDPAALEERRRALEPVASSRPPAPPAPPPATPSPALTEELLAVVAEERVPVVSFVFGPPPPSARDLDAVVLGTATTVEEARAVVAAGAHAVVAQGSEAGGHRGTFLGPAAAGLVGTLALVPQVVDAVDVPVVAAGGVFDGRGVAAALALGAEGVQVGTAFLLSPESAASPAHRRALAAARPGDSVVTPLWSGRAARTLPSDVLRALEQAELEPLPYPLQLAVTGGFHAAGIERDDPSTMFLLGGQAAGASRELPAAALVRALADEADAAIRRLAG